jgi:predicted Zn finger-like uncharacterized protein
MKAPVSCPNCASSFSISRASAGKKAKCPKCEQPFVISFDDGLPATDDFSSLPHSVPSQSVVPPRLPAVQEVRSTNEVATNKRRSTALAAPQWLFVVAPAVLTFILGYGLGFLIHHAPTTNTVAIGKGDASETKPSSPTPASADADHIPETTPELATAKPKAKSPSLSDHQLAVATDAVAAMGKIEAAIEIGVNYQKYTSTLADVNAAVNEADRSLAGSPITLELNAAMQAYKDVAEIWSFKIQYSSIGSTISKQFHAEIIERYADSLPKEEEIDTDVAMQLMWLVAGKRIERARSLLP